LSLEQAFLLVEKKELRTLSLLRNLISIDTCVPPGTHYKELVDLIEPLFKNIGYKTERVIIPPERIKPPLQGPRVNLVASKSCGNEPVSIYAHMDTVPIEEPWTHDPFKGEVENGCIYGRGVSDDKGPIASLVTALEVIHEVGMKTNFDPICCLCTDEEIGGYPGIYHLAREGYVKGHILSLDASSSPVIKLGSYGHVDITVTTFGKSAHSGRAYLGVNAVEAMVPVLNELLTLKETVEKRESSDPVNPNLAPLAPSKMTTPRFNIDIIKGGTKSNIVPSSCTIVINRRYIKEENYDSIKQETLAAVERGRKKSKALNVEVEFDHTYPPYSINPESKYAKKMRQAYKEVDKLRDQDFVLHGPSGSGDLALVAQELKTDNFVLCGVGRMPESRNHSSDENIRISDLISHSKKLIHYLCT
jgi:succinyl-diaminopimelate desuccinylase